MEYQFLISKFLLKTPLSNNTLNLVYCESSSFLIIYNGFLQKVKLDN